MSAVCSDELLRMTQLYIDKGNGATQLTNALESTSADFRYSLIENIRGWEKWGTNVLHTSAFENDINLVKCLLHRLSPEKMWQALAICTPTNQTALMIAGGTGNTATTKYLLDSTPEQYRFEYLKMKTEKGSTALHVTARGMYLQTVQVILSFVSPQQQVELLKLTNSKNQSTIDILSAIYPQGLPNEMQGTILSALVNPAVELVALRSEMLERFEHEREVADANRDIAVFSSHLEDDKAKITDLTKEVKIQKRKTVDLERKIAQQNEEAADAKRDIAVFSSHLEDDKAKITDLTKEVEMQKRKTADLERKIAQQNAEVADANGDIAVFSSHLENDKERISDLTKEVKIQKRKIADLKTTTAQQKEEIHQLKEMQKEMLARFETFLRQPICTSHVEDQEIPDID